MFHVEHLSFEERYDILFHMKQLNSPTQKKGKIAEKAVIEFIKRRGYEILTENYEIYGLGEIDIIAKKDNIIHSIEVKSIAVFVSSETDIKEAIKNSYNPGENIDKKKYQKIYKTTLKYLEKEGVSYETFQIDLYLVYKIKKKGEKMRFYIKRIKNLVVS